MPDVLLELGESGDVVQHVMAGRLAGIQQREQDTKQKGQHNGSKKDELREFQGTHRRSLTRQFYRKRELFRSRAGIHAVGIVTG